MAPNIFMSYSRRETGFVDDLTHRLEKADFNIWLDYRVLVPGTPWAGQIDKGIKRSRRDPLCRFQGIAFFSYVELEWRRGLNDKSALYWCSLKPFPCRPNYKVLNGWISRSNYKRALKQLSTLLNSPEQKMRPVPQSGFKAPLAIWFTAALALFVGIFVIRVLDDLAAIDPGAVYMASLYAKL
ncbi:MAG: toll/interleukin-1 receptor domain-containing protein [Anaerolineales bacterium]|uniref:toll/interleukin-1 receptor domain-containing protein n=1 Tax=Candidatus Villigracilis vicinus TaxID=3140679 RepID=UPI0031352A7A|nr:toll/interleukin-1 receptor domain-containing protein [Anaerolineales bacterium]